MERVILHCDADSFFAAVEAAKNGAYRDVPFAVCGDPKKRHGIVLAKNAQAKALGIKTGQTLWQAQRLCPDLQWCLPHHEEYERYCDALNRIYLSYTDRVEPYSIDESFLDVTASARLFGDGVAIATEIRRRVQAELGITVSVGVSFNRVFAKLGSDYQKPNGMTVITRENYQKILHPLPVERMLFVGQGVYKSLYELRIRTIGDLANASPALLCAKLGKIGEQLHAYANAQDLSEVGVFGHRSPPKSVGKGMTYEKDLTDAAQVQAALWYLCDRIGSRLRKLDMVATGISLAIKDPNLRVVRKQMQLAHPCDTAHGLCEAATVLYHTLWARQTPIRALTVTAGGLLTQEEQASQLSLLPDADEERLEKYMKVEQAVDRIRGRYGWHAVDAALGFGQEEPQETKEEE